MAAPSTCRSSLDAHFSRSHSLPLSFSSSSYGSSSWSSLSPNLASLPCYCSLDGGAGQSSGRPVHPSLSSSSPAATPRGVPRVAGAPKGGPSLVPDEVLIRTLEGYRYKAKVDDGGTLEVRSMAPGDDGGAGQSSGRPVHPSLSSSSPAATPRGVPRVAGAPKGGPSLVPDEVLIRTLEGYRYKAKVDDGGTLEVRSMAPGDDVGAAAKLLASSFADAMRIPPREVRFLEFWVRQYLEKKRVVRPHAATLVGFYREGEGAAAGPPHLVCTAEVWFDEMGDGDGPPAPAPPRGAPYIVNMTVMKDFRRRHIGWQLLKACEDLVLKVCNSSVVYLHCRLRDKSPLNMYKKAGYMVDKTDSFLVWLRFKHRKHLMYKELPVGYLQIE